MALPLPEIRELRDYTRARLHKVQDRAREWNRLEKLNRVLWSFSRRRSCGPLGR